jgi:hypothetical protein
MKLLRSDCSFGVGVGGYVAAMECRSVQVLRPSVSTSGGQSLGGAGGAAALRVDLVCEAQDANEVQERQLEERRFVSGLAWHWRRGVFGGLRLPVLAEDDAFGELLGWFGGCASSRALCGGRAAVLRFCAVGCHFYAPRCINSEIPTRSLRDKGGVYNVKIIDMDSTVMHGWRQLPAGNPRVAWKSNEQLGTVAYR